MTIEQIRAIVSQALVVEPASLRIELRSPIDVQSNRLYDVWAGDHHLIAKEFLNPTEWNEAPKREFHALSLLSPLDIAPEPVSFVPEAGPVVLYTFMEGQMWDRNPPTATDLAQLADVWLRMHRIPTEALWFAPHYNRSWQAQEAMFRAAFQSYADWATIEFPSGVQHIELCFHLLERYTPSVQQLTSYTPTLCFCRLDSRFANIIQRPNGSLGIIDWEDSGLCDPAHAVADLLTHANQEDLLDEAEWQAFLTPYLATQSEHDPTLYERCHIYRMNLLLLWLAILVKIGVARAQAGQIATWQVNGIPANQRLRRYLARALAWPDLDFERQLNQLASTFFFPE